MASSASDSEMFNPLLKAVSTSKTIEIHSLTKAMEARGETVVSLCVGEPDFPPPQGNLFRKHSNEDRGAE